MRQAPSETMDPRLVRHTDSLVCVQGSGGECIFLIPVQSPLAHNAPISIPKVSLVFPCLSRGAHSRDYLLLARCHCCHPQGLSPLNCSS